MPAGNPAQNCKRDSLISAGVNRKMFDAIAGRYDLMNLIMSFGLDRYWRRKAVKALAPQSGEQILDIGSGTGDIALEVVRQQPGVILTGIDPAGHMLDVAVKKTRQLGLQKTIRFESGNAMALQYPDSFFDGVVSAFCIRNVENRITAFMEMHRVLRPGGRAVVLELAKPENSLLRQCHRIYNRIYLPLVGKLLSHGDAYHYLVDSIEDFPESGIMLNKMRNGGFSKVSHIPLTGNIASVLIGKKKGDEK